jgi:hypothetical protein
MGALPFLGLQFSCKSSSDEAIVLKLPTAVRALLKQDDDEWPDQNHSKSSGFLICLKV